MIKAAGEAKAMMLVELDRIWRNLDRNHQWYFQCAVICLVYKLWAPVPWHKTRSIEPMCIKHTATTPNCLLRAVMKDVVPRNMCSLGSLWKRHKAVLELPVAQWVLWPVTPSQSLEVFPPGNVGPHECDCVWDVGLNRQPISGASQPANFVVLGGEVEKHFLSSVPSGENKSLQSLMTFFVAVLTNSCLVMLNSWVQ